MKIEETKAFESKDKREMSDIEILGVKVMAYRLLKQEAEYDGYEVGDFEDVTRNWFYSNKALQCDIRVGDVLVDSLFMVYGVYETVFALVIKLDENGEETQDDYIAMIEQ